MAGARAARRRSWRTAAASASLGQLAPSIAEQHGLPAGDAVYVAEIDLDSRWPRPTGRPAGRAAAAISVGDARHLDPRRRHARRGDRAADGQRRRARHARRACSEFDRYQGKGVPDGKVSLSLRLTFRSPDRTLTDAEVQKAMDARARGAASERHSAVQR